MTAVRIRWVRDDAPAPGRIEPVDSQPKRTESNRTESNRTESKRTEPVVLGDAPLPHGADPGEFLRGQGWWPTSSPQVSGTAGELTITYAVRPGARSSYPERVVATDEGLIRAEGEHPVVVQRVAAYAIVVGTWRDKPSMLVTQLSGKTSRAGVWTLPGGGVEPGEEPALAAQRECWEESGQGVDVGGLAFVHSSHWVGRAPHGRLEDYHAIRLVFAGRCPEPSEPVVHDVGGTTAAAAWAPLADIAQWPVTEVTGQALLWLIDPT